MVRLSVKKNRNKTNKYPMTTQTFLQIMIRYEDYSNNIVLLYRLVSCAASTEPPHSHCSTITTNLSILNKFITLSK